jgi:hypothetical protein
MVTGTNKRKVLSIKQKVKLLQEIENGKKKADVCGEFGLVNSTIKKIWKNRNRIITMSEPNRSRKK